jgi:hypothetical protein
MKLKYIDNKLIIFIILIIILFFLIFFSFFNFYEENINFSHYIESNDFVVGISSNGNYGAYDKNSHIYYFSKNIFNLHKIHIESSYKTKYKISRISDDEYNIFIYSSKYFQKRTIKLLDNSIISINSFDELGKREIPNLNNLNIYNRQDINIVFRMMDNDYKNRLYNSNNFVEPAVLRVRGASSTLFPKKSFKIEFSKKKSLLGMNKDDDWVLDALFMDKSKVRNLLSCSLWNKINDNQNINNDLRGEFVEVFIDNEYDGLFVLKQKVGKKSVNVSDTGFLAKSVNHMNDNYLTELISPNIKYVGDRCKFVYGNLEMKYCTVESLLNFKNKIMSYYVDNEFYTIDSNFDLTNYLNYYVFISFVSGVDNISKNLYFSMTDSSSEIIITPWDLDLTWGLDWANTGEFHSFFDMNLSTNNEWLEKNIISKIDESTFSLLKKRYWELRKKVITMDTINNYLDSYEDTLVNSGAAMRDSERWYQYDVEYEIEQIREWARRRIQFLDEYFK